MILVYVSGRYTGDIDTNIQVAREVAIQLWNDGYYVLCPHLNTAHFEVDCNASYEQYIAGDLRMLKTCDAVVMLPGWQESNGARIEKALAEKECIPVYIWPERPEVITTISRCPEQSEAFLETVMKMYRVHLMKNADYSPANIMGVGREGISTRMWDKVARMVNISGFMIDATGEHSVLLTILERMMDLLRLTGFRVRWALARWAGAKVAKNEPLDDAYMDLAVYSIIGLLLRRGKWGK